jgi:hypothetical protein
MRTHLNQIPTATWIALAIPALLLGYAVFSLVGPEILRAVVPQVVRTVLRLI